MKNEQVDWILGVLFYSFLAVMVPGIFYIFGEFFYAILKKLGDGMDWFVGLSWAIKIPAIIITGLIIQLYRPLHKSKN
jgi:hypothetical protein